MNALTEHWKGFWEGQTSPLHGSDSDEFYSTFSQELRLLFADKPFDSVLEIGCGSGELYGPLGFDAARVYRGIDLSQSMLDTFESRVPDIVTECCSGHSYLDDQKYDLVFNNGVIQYFDSKMLDQFFENAGSMLEQDGRFVCASIPWSYNRFAFSRGDISLGSRGAERRPLFPSLLSYAKRLVTDDMGIWYDLPELKRLASRHDFKVRFFGSMHFMYRIHAVFTKAST